MKKQSFIKSTSIILGVTIFFMSCSSTTLIQSNPSGAKVYLNGEPVGTTPYSHSDSKIVGSTTSVKLEKDGYNPLNTSFSRNEEADVGAIIGGVFLLFPFLWTMKYKPSRTYELIPLTGADQVSPSPQQPVKNGSKAEQLRELKQLFDEGLITEEEYEKERKRILESN
ncbi:PEGA domain-containing protein [Arthrospiribacter ruber]|uniref:PEGA domain-containing protein n=1 Tax=Arthrospiribacter ruber TaxID=2487934 RepID=A0A951J5S8_9BACT|nr:PEGA domain-containing protein [Arthrospiribacter ruber]MBW3470288.1 PEGA domain-containing protein [Arthrospiribacter ruber]